jgi:hypothetical protein
MFTDLYLIRICLQQVITSRKYFRKGRYFRKNGTKQYRSRVLVWLTELLFLNSEEIQQTFQQDNKVSSKRISD